MTTIKSRMKTGATDGAEVIGDAGETAARQPLPMPPGGWPADAWTGMAGRFVRDPFTGVRSPAPDEDEPATVA